ncbi:MAG: terpene cyclase/mutase family protein [Armatimonadetes bacterium]|nr:terpene cyclase/mutase family protein [Armatimonadota bacterium]
MGGYLTPAIAFIQDNGDELERARLSGLLGRTRPDPKAARTLLSRQRDDGGFPFEMISGRPSAVTATVTAIRWMVDLRLMPSPYVERAVGYFLMTQRPDGSWDESPSVIKFDPPPQIRPGHPAGRAYCTATAGFWMTRLMGSRHDAVQRAAGYLRSARNGDRPAPDFLSTDALEIATLAMVEGRVAEIVTAGLAALGAVPADRWNADALADALTGLYGAGFSLDEPFVAWAVRCLLTLQRSEGGWSSARGQDHDVDLSPQALGALLALGVPSA